MTLEQRIQALESQVQQLRQRLDQTHSRLYDQITSGVDAVIEIVITQHHQLGGLQDDDHPQYVAVADGRTITAQHIFNPQGAPFIVGQDARGIVVDGLKADMVHVREGTPDPNSAVGTFFVVRY